jgi:DNA-binding CsgD family transcriptional regulator
VIAAGYRLTAREAQTMTLLLRGLPTKTIAEALWVTMNTANDHIKAIFAKTCVSSHGELMAAVFQVHSAPGHDTWPARSVMRCTSAPGCRRCACTP